MSNSFSNSDTREGFSVDREVENRFQDHVRGQNVSRDSSYSKPHDDSAPKTDPDFRVQKGLSEIDRAEHLMNCGIKTMKDQFPGGDMKNLSFDEKIDMKLGVPVQKKLEDDQSGGIHIDIDSHKDLSLEDKIEKKLAAGGAHQRLQQVCQQLKIGSAMIKTSAKNFEVSMIKEEDAAALQGDLENDAFFKNVKRGGKIVRGDINPNVG